MVVAAESVFLLPMVAENLRLNLPTKQQNTKYFSSTQTKEEEKKGSRSVGRVPGIVE